MEAWLDGTPVMVHRDVDLRGDYQRFGLNQFMLSRRAKQDSPTQSLFWDDIRVHRGAAPPTWAAAAGGVPAAPAPEKKTGLFSR